MATAASMDISQTHPYTCNSCAVAFRTGEAQRVHMRSDWHRYNLKRRIADLPPVSTEDFNEKVIAAQSTNNAAAAQATFTKTCSVCQKTYFSENAHQNHIGSKAHKTRVLAMTREILANTGSDIDPSISHQASEPAEIDPEADAEFEEVVAHMKETNISVPSPVARRPSAPPPDAEPREEHPMSPPKVVPTVVPLSTCLFCNYNSPTWKLSLMHMSRIHGLFIPEQNYLMDPEGLIGYLQAKIHENYECLWCHKLKGTREGVQTHMRDKGHCRIAFETEEEMIEVGQFYDFSSTYSDPEAQDSDIAMEQSEAKQNGGVRLPKSADDTPEDEGWETDSSFSSLDSNELTSVPNDDRTESYGRLHLHRHHSHTDPRPHRNADGFHSHAHSHKNAVFYDENEMHLPSGRVAGHRNLRKYFRQNLHTYPTVSERTDQAQRLIEEGDDGDVEMEEDGKAHPLNSSSRALTKRGESGMIGATTAQRKEVRDQEIRGRQKEQRMQRKYEAKLEKQANHQKHYRDPMLQ